MRRLLLLLALVLVLLGLCLPATAGTAGRIVVFGAESGANLELSLSHGNLRVDGLMSSEPGAGCNVARSRVHAACPLSRAESIEVVAGDSGDLIEVTHRLPLPLTVHLGGGRDKFIGNGERDTCFPEGARRNRCVGGPGDDVCITGERNSDCVGGPGDDYCRTGAGSDGCWGDEGDDYCFMGPGEDGCHGGPGNDRLYGGSDPDQLYGGGGFDYCDGGAGTGKSHNCEAGPRH